jgi:hypothetical protein
MKKKTKKKLRLLPTTSDKYDPKDGRDFDYAMKVWFDEGDCEWIVEVLGTDDARPFVQMVSAKSLESALAGMVELIDRHIQTGESLA